MGLDQGGGRRPVALRQVASRRPGEPAQPIAQVSLEPARARRTGVPELDRVLGGGLVPGAVVLLAGEPGIGKSTLLLDVAQQWAVASAAAGIGPALVVSGEESKQDPYQRKPEVDAPLPGPRLPGPLLPLRGTSPRRHV